MLTQARSRLATALRRPALARNLCAPAVPLVDQVRADLVGMKAKISQKTVGGYTALISQQHKCSVRGPMSSGNNPFLIE